MRERWHPLLFAIYPVLFLYAHNSSNLPLGVLSRPLTAALLLGVAALVFASLVVRDSRPAALLAAAMVLMWGSYGHFVALLPESGLIGKTLKHHRVLLPLGMILLGALVLALRRGHPNLQWMNFLTLGAKGMSLTLVGFSLFTIGSGLWQDTRISRADLQLLPTETILLPTRHPQEDIYHIILDGYPRADVLQDLYGMDNRSFVNSLGQRGFSVADSAQSNYAQTLLSVVSTLKGQYFIKDGFSSDDGWAYRRQLARILGTVLHDRSHILPGGWLRAFSTGYSATEILDADEFLSPAISLNEFERALVALTPLDAVLNLVESRYGNVLHRQRVEFTFENLPVKTGAPPRAFTFAHIVAPHPPFVFSPVGATFGAVVPMADGDHIVGPDGLSAEQYRQAYCAQVEAVNQRLLKAVDAILEGGRPSVILVHGDHGPASLLRWEEAHPDPESAWERFSILLAVRMPDEDPDVCWPTMSPLNAVRVVQDRLYGTQQDTLLDQSYFSTWSRPFEFVEVP